MRRPAIKASSVDFAAPVPPISSTRCRRQREAHVAQRRALLGRRDRALAFDASTVCVYDSERTSTAGTSTIASKVWVDVKCS